MHTTKVSVWDYLQDEREDFLPTYQEWDYSDDYESEYVDEYMMPYFDAKDYDSGCRSLFDPLCQISSALLQLIDRCFHGLNLVFNRLGNGGSNCEFCWLGRLTGDSYWRSRGGRCGTTGGRYLAARGRCRFCSRRTERR